MAPSLRFRFMISSAPCLASSLVLAALAAVSAPSASRAQEAAAPISAAPVSAAAPAAVATLRAAPPPESAEQAARFETLFQQGMAAMQAADHETAIRAFRTMLAEEPALVRVRLELGRAYFRAGRYDDSAEAFEYALSGPLPDAARAAAMSYLRAIEAHSDFTWDLELSVGLAPELFRDWDENRVPIDFFGYTLDFQADRENRNALLSLSFAAEAEYRKEIGRIDGDVRTLVFARGALSGDTRDTTPAEPENLSASARLGLRFVPARSTVSVWLEQISRIQDNDRAEDLHLLNLSWTRRFDDGLTLSLSGAGGLTDNHIVSGLDGRLWTGGATVVKSIGGRAYAGATGRATRRVADDPARSSWTLRAGALGGYEFQGGYALSGQVYVERYEEADRIRPIAVTRQETEYGIELQLSAKDLYFRGFTPFIGAGLKQRDSTIPAYGYRDAMLTFGVERAF